MELDAFERCCRILDVSSAADAEQIRKAYRLLTKVWHPDRFTEDPTVQREATDRMKAINDAYHQLERAGFRPEHRPAPSVVTPARAATRPRPVTELRPFVELDVQLIPPDSARVGWSRPAPHPNLFGQRPRILLAALVQSRALAEAQAVRTELLLRLEDVGQQLARGDDAVTIAPWVLRPNSRENLRVWPRNLVTGSAAPGAGAPSSWRAMLYGAVTPRLEVSRGDHAAGVDAWVLPVVLAVVTLAAELSPGERRRLGRVLHGVNDYFSSPCESFDLNSQRVAIAGILPLLQPVVMP